MLKSLKKAVLQNPIVLAAPFETPLDRRPVTVHILSPEGFSLDNVQKFSLAALLIPTVLVCLFSLFTAQWMLVFICGFMLSLLGLVFALIHLRSRMTWRATWHGSFVEVEDGRYGPVENWREPYSAFTGLKRDYGLLPRAGNYGAGRRVYGLMLVHPNPERSVLLHASYEDIPEEIVGNYARHFGLPVVDS